MKLCIFVNDFKTVTDTVERLSAEKLGLIFIQNGVFHATIKENGKSSHLLEKPASFYVLAEDLATRGLTDADVDKRVKIVNYGDVVDLIFNEYEKIIWL
ncbi:MAG: DsrH/TusB family sulfur relay protein [Thermodesulfovibrionales bacterium]|nr:DsrH/TusB family sulfur relay protein [Thermodesulfovibrionales bacterium]